MENKIEIAAIGNKNTIALFNVVGIKIYFSSSLEEVNKTIHQLANQGCKIIYVTEEIYSTLNETLERYQSLPFPIIIPIPFGLTSDGTGQKKIKENVEKAIGINIF